MKKFNGFGLMVCLLVVCMLSGCTSTPKTQTPRTLVYNNSIPEEQMATLYIPPGSFEVVSFNGALVYPQIWHVLSLRDPALIVSIPACYGIHVNNDHRNCTSELIFNYWDKTYGNASLVKLNFYPVAGRNYRLWGFWTDGSILSGRSSFTFIVYENSETRQPNPNEQLVIINAEKGGFVVVIIDKGTVNERYLLLDRESELRFIVPKGEHTIHIEDDHSLPRDSPYAIQPIGTPPRSFTASSDIVRFSVITQKTKGVRQYVLTQK